MPRGLRRASRGATLGAAPQARAECLGLLRRCEVGCSREPAQPGRRGVHPGRALTMGTGANGPRFTLSPHRVQSGVYCKY